MIEDQKSEFIISCLSSEKDDDIIAGLLQIPLNIPDNIPSNIIIKHIKNKINAIKIYTAQALGCYKEKYHKDITEFINENELEIDELTMLQAALTTEYSDYGFSYFYDLLSKDSDTKEIAMDMLSKYEELAVIPLLSKIDDASEEELETIKRIYYKIGKAKSIRVVQGIPYYPLMDKMLRIFSEKELREIYET